MKKIIRYGRRLTIVPWLTGKAWAVILRKHEVEIDTWFSYTKFLVAFRYLKRSPKCLKSSVEYLKGLATCFETKTWSYFLSKGISANLARLIFRIYIWLIRVAAISWVTRPASCQLAPLIANVFATEYLNLA